jgi:hypothetical protein
MILQPINLTMILENKEVYATMLKIVKRLKFGRRR